MLNYLHLSQSRNGRAPTPDETVTIKGEGTVTLLLYLLQIEMMMSPVDRYRGRLLRLHSLLAWRSHLYWELTTEQ